MCFEQQHSSHTLWSGHSAGMTFISMCQTVHTHCIYEIPERIMIGKCYLDVSGTLKYCRPELWNLHPLSDFNRRQLVKCLSGMVGTFRLGTVDPELRFRIRSPVEFPSSEILLNHQDSAMRFSRKGN